MSSYARPAWFTCKACKAKRRLGPGQTDCPQCGERLRTRRTGTDTSKTGRNSDAPAIPSENKGNLAADCSSGRSQQPSGPGGTRKRTREGDDNTFNLKLGSLFPPSKDGDGPVDRKLKKDSGTRDSKRAHPVKPGFDQAQAPKGTGHLTEPKWCLKHHHRGHKGDSSCGVKDNTSSRLFPALKPRWDALMSEDQAKVIATSKPIPSTVLEVIAHVVKLSALLGTYPEFIVDRDEIAEDALTLVDCWIGNHAVIEWQDVVATCAVHTHHVCDRLSTIVHDLEALISKTLLLTMVQQQVAKSGVQYTEEEMMDFAKSRKDGQWPTVDPVGLITTLEKIRFVAQLDTRIQRAMRVAVTDLILINRPVTADNGCLRACLIMPTGALLISKPPDQVAQAGFDVFSFQDIYPMKEKIRKLYMEAIGENEGAS